MKSILSGITILLAFAFSMSVHAGEVSVERATDRSGKVDLSVYKRICRSKAAQVAPGSPDCLYADAKDLKYWETLKNPCDGPAKSPWVAQVFGKNCEFWKGREVSPKPFTHVKFCDYTFWSLIKNGFFHEPAKCQFDYIPTAQWVSFAGKSIQEGALPMVSDSKSKDLVTISSGAAGEEGDALTGAPAKAGSAR